MRCFDVHELTIPQINYQRCPKCGSFMRLEWIEPDRTSGYDRRTFECRYCQHVDTIVVKYR